MSCHVHVSSIGILHGVCSVSLCCQIVTLHLAECCVFQIWSIPDFSLVGSLKHHRRAVLCVQFSPKEQVWSVLSDWPRLCIVSDCDWVCVVSK